MRGLGVLLFTVAFVACGGRIVGTPSDGGVDERSDDPLGGGGKLVTGDCTFKVSFKPNGMDWIFLTDSPGVTTGSRPGQSLFRVLCTGRGNESFYYAMSFDPTGTAPGTYAVTGEMDQTSNGREREVAIGACTVVVASDVVTDGMEFVSGTFACASMRDDPIGDFKIAGTFRVPLL